MLNVLKLEAPWMTYRKKVNALFEKDKLIDVGEIYQAEDGNGYAFDVTVHDHDKYLALDRVLRRSVTLGYVKLAINLIDADRPTETDAIDLYTVIFDGNSIVKDIKDVEDQAGAHHGFVRFVPEVVQFYADDISDYSGNFNGLAEDIAREVFADDAHGVNFCTASLQEKKIELKL